MRHTLSTSRHADAAEAGVSFGELSPAFALPGLTSNNGSRAGASGPVPQARQEYSNRHKNILLAIRQVLVLIRANHLDITSRIIRRHSPAFAQKIDKLLLKTGGDATLQKLIKINKQCIKPEWLMAHGSWRRGLGPSLPE
jgi:hypothetical protein